ncbi:MarR family transcriptional regulator [Flexivirga sp. ID2601S]|uniref:MarR family transcriptional regulator n=1 Tax=Flexivirga aerilata TaxID=1656889 RepID=A0A849ACJ5_9MICO|nr:MarR family transcriptional regulator [Flexivirga aerilata]NNG38245.1 MarR family transcriptional regulator [Flexivirga aerilata]
MAQSRTRTWRSYFESSILLQTRLDDELRADAGMSLFEYHLLLLLVQADGRMRMGDLARAMVFSSSRLTYQVGVLERRGWVSRQRDEHDARVNWACITAEGHRAFQKAGRPHLALVRSLFLDDLSDDELAVLDRVFTRLLGELRE